VKQEQAVELGLPLEELVRRGARDILRQAIEVEVQMRIPDEGDRRFHAKTTTNSTRRRPPIPVKTATSG
jgi:hypothetical protein